MVEIAAEIATGMQTGERLEMTHPASFHLRNTAFYKSFAISLWGAANMSGNVVEWTHTMIDEDEAPAPIGQKAQPTAPGGTR